MGSIFDNTRLLPLDKIVIMLASELGEEIHKPTEVIVDGVLYSNFELCQLNRCHSQHQYFFLGKTTKTDEEIKAEAVVKAAEEALKFAKLALEKVKER